MTKCSFVIHGSYHRKIYRKTTTPTKTKIQPSTNRASFAMLSQLDKLGNDNEML